VRSGNYNVVIGETEQDVKDKLAWIIAHYEPLVPADQLARYKKMFETGPLVGTPDLIIERLREAEQLGLSYAIGNFVDFAYDRSSVELFEKRVVPELSGSS
jgi:alkanesulfonate monooxygenase SsuD/methylene tetrahydromethanopterin reductase-like flavin-dependent oxidoreductase (luciferase family)